MLRSEDEGWDLDCVVDKVGSLEILISVDD